MTRIDLKLLYQNKDISCTTSAKELVSFEDEGGVLKLDFQQGIPIDVFC